MIKSTDDEACLASSGWKIYPVVLSLLPKPHHAADTCGLDEWPRSENKSRWNTTW